LDKARTGGPAFPDLPKDPGAVELAKGLEEILAALDPTNARESFWNARKMVFHFLDRAADLGLIQVSPSAEVGASPSRGPVATSAQSSGESAKHDP